MFDSFHQRASRWWRWKAHSIYQLHIRRCIYFSLALTVCQGKTLAEVNLQKKWKLFGLKHLFIFKSFNIQSDIKQYCTESEWLMLKESYILNMEINESCFTVSDGRYICFLERVDISEETVESIDQVAVMTSNILFFIIMFIFAIFETYVFLQRRQTHRWYIKAGSK